MPADPPLYEDWSGDTLAADFGAGELSLRIDPAGEEGRLRPHHVRL